MNDRHDPAGNRINGYEVGWFALLLRMRAATEQDLRAAQDRVTRALIARHRAQRVRDRRCGRRGRDG
ncbi:MAG: hypothetical protein EBZ74_04235 [Planctomycetia bacterium]|nr:hypothetical protein [Planctomycetia bacterium]